AIFIEGNFTKYRDVSTKFMAILADFSPFLEPMGIDEAYLDVTGFESLHGSIRQMAARIKRRVRDELGIRASVGIASSKVVAKIASDLSKPDGLIEVAPGGEGSFLKPLPVAKLPGIGKKMGSVFSQLGIDTVGKISLTPLSLLKSRFGVYGELLYRLASGIDNRQVEPPAAAKSISRETTFARDIRKPGTIEATLRYLSERVGSKLRRRGRQTRCITLKLRYADFTTITRRHTLARATDADQAIFGTGQGLLLKALARERRAVRLIGIGVSGLVEPGRQLDMLDPAAARLEQLNTAIDRIRTKYGFTAIQTGRTLRLREIFPQGENGYTLPTPSLSR
ncbi:MAG: DNA polymerase IV, partial [Dehalococcoidales bacterium]